MHSNNLVLAIKAKNKPLREFDGTVYLPFGTEYSILLKNLDFRRVRIQILIDGQDVLDGTKLVIDGRSDAELKRFIVNGNLQQGNSFKFIEKTEKISKHRGDRLEDGLVTIYYEFEQPISSMVVHPLIETTPIEPYRKWIPPYPLYNPTWKTTANAQYISKGTRNSSSELCSAEPTNVLRNVEPTLMSSTVVTGITAPGSINDQKFVTASYFSGDGLTHTMTLELRGETKDTKVAVTQPVTVKKLKRCMMCGTNVKQIAKFCHECGSSVEVV